jgi:hypothetical protein
VIVPYMSSHFYTLQETFFLSLIQTFKFALSCLFLYAYS